MPLVIYDTQDIVGNGRYKQHVRFSTFPGGIRYALTLVEISTGKRILLYDVHRGKPHHRHLRDKETTYNFVNEITLLSDFLRDVGPYPGWKTMKTRRLNIGIRNSAERAKALYEAVQRVTHGDHTPQEPELYFENVEQLRRMLTNKRLDLLHTIARHHPTSVHQLAELVHRDYKNVSTDIELLERLGLVNVGAPTGKGRSHALSVPYDEIRLTIKLGQRKKLHAA